MNVDMVRPIIESSLQVGAPVEALQQARDVFEMVLCAAEKVAEEGDDEPTGNVFKWSAELSSTEERNVASILKAQGIDDPISFRTLLGCADLMLANPLKHDIDSVVFLFRLLLRVLS